MFKITDMYLFCGLPYPIFNLILKLIAPYGVLCHSAGFAGLNPVLPGPPKIGGTTISNSMSNE